MEKRRLIRERVSVCVRTDKQNRQKSAGSHRGCILRGSKTSPFMGSTSKVTALEVWQTYMNASGFCRVPLVPKMETTIHLRIRGLLELYHSSEYHRSTKRHWE
ncbi:MAG: hypothetical protein HXS41_09350 [Theionarchaea archaeon]|nr:hypothetical protein [Theionarchaea archaeon]